MCKVDRYSQVGVFLVLEDGFVFSLVLLFLVVSQACEQTHDGSTSKNCCQNVAAPEQFGNTGLDLRPFCSRRTFSLDTMLAYDRGNHNTEKEAGHGPNAKQDSKTFEAPGRRHTPHFVHSGLKLGTAGLSF